MKKILVAIDGSAASVHAARVALELATGQGGDVTLVHVVPPAFVPPEVPFGIAPWTEEALRGGEKLLEEAVRELGNPKVDRVNLSGAPAETIADYAARERFDLVVVGSKGRNAVARVLIGSVTDRLVHICKTPVLVVR